MKKLYSFVSLSLLLITLLACKVLGGGGKNYPETEEGLKQLASDLAAASPSDSAKMGTALALPDANAFFTSTVGAENAAKISSDYTTEAAKLGTIHGFFRAAQRGGKTEILTEKHTSPDDDESNMLQETAIRAMVKPTALEPAG